MRDSSKMGTDLLSDLLNLVRARCSLSGRLAAVEAGRAALTISTP
jgi:hypothetical protein